MENPEQLYLISEDCEAICIAKKKNIGAALALYYPDEFIVKDDPLNPFEIKMYFEHPKPGEEPDSRGDFKVVYIEPVHIFEPA